MQQPTEGAQVKVVRKWSDVFGKYEASATNTGSSSPAREIPPSHIRLKALVGCRAEVLAW